MKRALTEEQKESIELWIFDDTSLELSSDPKVRGLQIDHALIVLRGCCTTLSSSKYRLKYRELLKASDNQSKVIDNTFIH